MTGVEFAWRAHAAQEQWAARVDTKATIVLTVEAAVVAAVVTALSSAGISSVPGWRISVLWTGTALSAVAVLIAFLVIMPRLGRRDTASESSFLYFGGLRHWESRRLVARLDVMSDEEQIAQLGAQLTYLAAINWQKYRLLQAGIGAAVLGMTLLAVALS